MTYLEVLETHCKIYKKALTKKLSTGSVKNYILVRLEDCQALSWDVQRKEAKPCIVFDADRFYPNKAVHIAKHLYGCVARHIHDQIQLELTQTRELMVKAKGTIGHVAINNKED